MLVVVLLAVFVLVVTVVVATIAAVRRDGHGAIPESVAYDTRRPLPCPGDPRSSEVACAVAHPDAQVLEGIRDQIRHPFG